MIVTSEVDRAARTVRVVQRWTCKTCAFAPHPSELQVWRQTARTELGLRHLIRKGRHIAKRVAEHAEGEP